MSAESLEATLHSCGSHLAYKLTCSEASALSIDARGHCQRCGQVARRLLYDHDHAVGWHAVRGLVCDSCNQHLERVDSGARDPDELDLAYLSDPWHVKHRPGLVDRLARRRRPRMVVMSFRLPVEVRDQLVAKAEAAGMNPTEVVRDLVAEWAADEAGSEQHGRQHGHTEEGPTLSDQPF